MSSKLKVYYDAEFTGLYKDTSLISIGLVCEDGHYFYAEFNDYDTRYVDRWIHDNVLNNLMFNHIREDFIMNESNVFIKGDNGYVASKLKMWLDTLSNEHNKQVQIYSDCYAYDWVLFNDLICEDGCGLNIPEYIYYIPMDLSTTLQIYGYDPDINREEFIGDDILNNIKSFPVFNLSKELKHNSLWDAYVCKYCFDKLQLDRE